MSAYLSVCKLRFINGLQYRTAAFAGLTTQLFFGLIFIMVYVAFYNGSTKALPMELNEVVTYVWLQQIFLGLIMLWLRDNEIFGLITNGNIAYELCRPVEMYGFWYSKLLAQRVANTVLRCLPIAFIVLLLPQPYRLSLPHSWSSFTLFLIALLLGLLVTVSISMLIYISVFWTMSPVGSIMMIAVASELLAGMILPIPLMPIWMQNITYFLPFRWTVDFPFRVYSGHIPYMEAIWGIAIQLIWLILLIAVGTWCLRKALRRVVLQGG